MWKEDAVACFSVLCKFLGENEENHVKLSVSVASRRAEVGTQDFQNIR